MNQAGELLGPRIPRKSNKVTNLGPRIPRSQFNTDRIADHLVDKFKSPGYRNFFLHIAWRFEEDTINKHVATAFEKGNNPRAYFIRLMKNQKEYYA